MSHYWETEIPTVISMDLLLLEFCSGRIADESMHLLGKYSNVDVLFMGLTKLYFPPAAFAK